MKAFGVQAPLWLKVASASGFIVTLIYISFTVIPIIEVESRLLFAVKIIAVVIIANVIGLVLYVLRKR